MRAPPYILVVKPAVANENGAGIPDLDAEAKLGATDIQNKKSIRGCGSA